MLAFSVGVLCWNACVPVPLTVSVFVPHRLCHVATCVSCLCLVTERCRYMNVTLILGTFQTVILFGSVLIRWKIRLGLWQCCYGVGVIMDLRLQTKRI